MKIFYVEDIQDGVYRLNTVTGKYKENVTAEGLKELSTSSIIIGYNRLTGQVAVKSKDDVIAYMNTKAKIAGSNFNSEYIIEKAERVYDKESGLCTMTIKPDRQEYGVDIDCIYDIYTIDWAEIFKEESENNINITANIIIDLPEVRQIKGVKIHSSGVYDDELMYDSLNAIRINSIEIVNKNMFANCESINNLFCIRDISSTFMITTDNFKLDLSDCKFKTATAGDVEALTTQNMFKNLSNIILPDTFYTSALHKGLFDWCTVSREQLIKYIEYLNTKDYRLKLHRYSKVSTDILYYKDFVYFSNLTGNKYLPRFLSIESIGKFIIDDTVNTSTGRDITVSTNMKSLEIQTELKGMSEELKEALYKLMPVVTEDIGGNSFKIKITPEEILKCTDIHIYQEILKNTDIKEVTQYIDLLYDDEGVRSEFFSYVEKFMYLTVDDIPEIDIYTNLSKEDIKIWVYFLQNNQSCIYSDISLNISNTDRVYNIKPMEN